MFARYFSSALLIVSIGLNSYSQKKLVWSDEFDKKGLPDSAKWGYDVGGTGWGNKELQFYTDGRKENAFVDTGHLVIEARMENYQGRKYSSARLVSKNKVIGSMAALR